MLLYELRYAVMRLLRLVVALASEAACLGLAIVAGATLAGSLGAIIGVVEGSTTVVRMLAVWLICAASASAMVGSWALAFAVATPYKYKTRVPGLELVDCKKCGRRIPNTYHCPECGSFRWETAGFSLVWGLSAMVTVAWILHDLTFAAILLWPGKRA